MIIARDASVGLKNQHKALLTGLLLTDLSNTAAFLFFELGNLNWAGFYIFSPKKDRLVLGPFQGKVACTEIHRNRGVCGAAYSSQSVMNVPDVHKFPDHIVCDQASLSELVVPINLSNGFSMVLDLDAPVLSRFDSGTERLVIEICKNLELQEYERDVFGLQQNLF